MLLSHEKCLVLVHFQTGIIRQRVRIEAGFTMDTVREVAIKTLEKAVSEGSISMIRFHRLLPRCIPSELRNKL